MYRMYGIPQRAREGGAVMYRMYGIPQRAREGAFGNDRVVNNLVRVLFCANLLISKYPSPAMSRVCFSETAGK